MCQQEISIAREGSCATAHARMGSRIVFALACMILTQAACQPQGQKSAAAPALGRAGAAQTESYIDHLQLEIVPLERVIPHEYIDPVRVDDLAKFTQSHQLVANPIIAARSGDNYVVMDGATRTAALKSIHASYGIVQVVREDTGFSLGTWYHAIPSFPEDTLVRLLDGLPLLRIEELLLLPPKDERFIGTDIAYVEMANGRVLVVHPRPGVEALDALNQFTGAYTEAVGAGGTSKVQRTRAETLEEAQQQFGAVMKVSALVIYPSLTLNDVTAVVDSGSFVPAGITRSIVNGRLLNLSVPLEWLSGGDIATRNQELLALVANKKARGEYFELPAGTTVCEENGPRPYAEALIVLQPFNLRYFPTGTGDCEPDGIYD